jgi:N-acetylmuramoyl-L-alanine amidase
MKHGFLGAIVTAACLATAAQARAGETVRELYTRAMAQERQVRDDATKPTLAQMRRTIALYESVVRKHPASAYCDNALWQGANLAALAYDRFGDEADRRTAARLLSLLKSEYPSSKLLPQASDTLASLEKRPSPPDPEIRSTPVAPPRPALTDATPKTRSETAPAGVTVLKDVKRTVLPDGVRITVELDAETAYHQEEIANPRRLFFDLRNVKAAPALQDTSLKFDGDVVKEIRLGRHPQNTTRLVMDMEGAAGYTVYPLYGPYRLVIDVRRPLSGTPLLAERTAPIVPERPAVTKAVTVTPPPPPPPVVQPKSGAPAFLPAAAAPWLPAPPPPPAGLSERSESKGPAAPERVTKGPVQDERPESRAPAPNERNGSRGPAVPDLPARTSVPAQPPGTPVANSNGKFSLSRQLGLGVSRIVIDAGHGGHDPGAHGSGINEAELTLDVAQRLQKLLDKAGVDVVMTRDTDVFIPLEERTAIANREGADLFLSIHANASRNTQARGVETYFLNFATNPEAEAVAARENATSGKPMHSLPDIVKAIALNNKIHESRDFASMIQNSLHSQLQKADSSVRNLGVKQAPFMVLLGATMPSVLAEISFITNKQDAAMLKTEKYRQRIADALLAGVLRYQQSLKAGPQIAEQ